jgi:hypothetical protein
MKIPHLRVLSVSAVTLATAAAVGLSTTAASAASTAAGSRASTVATTAPAASVGSITSKVTGTFTNADGTGTFTGTFTPRKFSVVNGALEATGLLKGTLVDANGTQLGTVSQTVTDTVSTASPASTTNAANAPVVGCGILNLVLGPLNLNLLGLVVQLNQVNLVITAVPGAGNLLGNLLCSVVGLLNGGGALSGLLGEITTLLNSILALL